MDNKERYEMFYKDTFNEEEFYAFCHREFSCSPSSCALCQKRIKDLKESGKEVEMIGVVEDFGIYTYAPPFEFDENGKFLGGRLCLQGHSSNYNDLFPDFRLGDEITYGMYLVKMENAKKALISHLENDIKRGLITKYSIIYDLK